MRVLSSLLLAGAVGLGGFLSMPGTAAAEGYGGWRGRNYYRDYVPPQARVPFYGYNYGSGFRSGSQFYYGVPSGYGYSPQVRYGVRPGPGVGLFGGSRTYGVAPGPGVGVFRGPGFSGIAPDPGFGVFGGPQVFSAAPGFGTFGGAPALGARSGIGVGLGVGGGARR